MNHNATSIRPFIGSANFDVSRRFYKELGFAETILTHNLILYTTNTIGFYLQDYYAKDWVDNTMIFLEVDNVERYWNELKALELEKKFEKVKLVPIRNLDWGRECFLHDPSGILWHIGEFKK